MKVKVIGAGKREDPFRVNLPTYSMVPGTEEYTDAEKKILKSVEVEVPADECDDEGRPDKLKIRKKYKGQKWDRADVLDDLTP